MKREIKIIPPDVMSEEEAKAFVAEGDDRFDRDIEALTDSIARESGVRIIKLAGPSCAGKTTASRKIIKSFAKRNIEVVAVSVDSFFYDREHLHALSKDKGDGELDYDSPDTINFELFGKFITGMLEKGEADCPIFDFETGRADEFERMTLPGGAILLIEGIQAFYRQLDEVIKGYKCISVYISALSSLSYRGRIFEETDIRLMRRIVRDARVRATPYDKTLDIWRTVRSNEEKNIFPFIGRADYLIDSTMPYELFILKPYIDSILGESEDERALAILEGVEKAYSISSELISQDSLYKEFV